MLVTGGLASPRDVHAATLLRYIDAPAGGGDADDDGSEVPWQQQQQQQTDTMETTVPSAVGDMGASTVTQGQQPAKKSKTWCAAQEDVRRQRKSGQQKESRHRIHGWDAMYAWLREYFKQDGRPQKTIGKLFARIKKGEPSEPDDYTADANWSGKHGTTWLDELASYVAVARFAVNKIKSRLLKPVGDGEGPTMGNQTNSDKRSLADTGQDLDQIVTFANDVRRYVDSWAKTYGLPSLPLKHILDFDWGKTVLPSKENTILSNYPLKVLSMGKEQAGQMMFSEAFQQQIVWAQPAGTWKLWLDNAIPEEDTTLTFALDVTANYPLGDDDKHVVRSCDGEIHFEWDERARTLKPTVGNAEPHAPDQAPVARIPLCNSVVMWYTSPSNVAGIVSNDRRDSMQAWAFGHTNEAQTVRNVATPGAKPDVNDMSKVDLHTEAVANDLLQPPTRKTWTIPSLKDVVLRNRQQTEGVPLTNVELYRLMKEFEDFNDVECPSDGESSLDEGSDHEADPDQSTVYKLHGSTTVNHGGTLGAIAICPSICTLNSSSDLLIVPRGHAVTFQTPHQWLDDLNLGWEALLGKDRALEQKRWSQWVSKQISSSAERGSNQHVNHDPAMSSFPGVAYGTATTTSDGTFLTPEDEEALTICHHGGAIAGRIKTADGDQWVEATAPKGYKNGTIRVTTETPKHPMYYSKAHTHVQGVLNLLLCGKKLWKLTRACVSPPPPRPPHTHYHTHGIDF